MTISDYLTISELSHYLKLPEETIYKYARGGRIPASKVGRYWRFERAAIDGWVRERSNKAGCLRAMVVDDESVIRQLMQKWLQDAGCAVDVFAGGAEAVRGLEEVKYDMIFLDLMMPHMNGVETLEKMLKIHPTTNVVIVTAYFDSQLMERALNLGPLTILKKPVARETVTNLIQSLNIKV